MKRSKGIILLWRRRNAPSPAQLARFTAAWLPAKLLAPAVIERMRGGGLDVFEYTDETDAALLGAIRTTYKGARITIER